MKTNPSLCAELDATYSSTNTVPLFIGVEAMLRSRVAHSHRDLRVMDFLYEEHPWLTCVQISYLFCNAVFFASLLWKSLFKVDVHYFNQKSPCCVSSSQFLSRSLPALPPVSLRSILDELKKRNFSYQRTK